MTYHLCDVRVRIHIAVTLLCYVLFLRVLFFILLSGSVVEVFTATNILTGLFYQDSFMMKSFAAYPEMIYIDSTYKMGENRMTLYIIVVVDGWGKSTEDRLSLEQHTRAFKHHNPQWTDTKVIMSDKDITERNITIRYTIYIMLFRA